MKIHSWVIFWMAALATGMAVGNAAAGDSLGAGVWAMAAVLEFGFALNAGD